VPDSSGRILDNSDHRTYIRIFNHGVKKMISVILAAIFGVSLGIVIGILIATRCDDEIHDIHDHNNIQRIFFGD
jgi:ABC-type proline/glycine betaine transport system permease subunit